MKKRLLALFLTLVLLLCACSEAGGNQPTGSTETQSSVQEGTVPQDTTAPSAATEGSHAATVPSTTGQTEATTATTVAPENCTQHTDANDDYACDTCSSSVAVTFDFYVVNDLHGKIADADTHPGVDEMTTYFKNARWSDENAIILSAGDMWQGSYESNLTNGLLTTEWMNKAGFTGMALGNHEFDWGTDKIRANYEIANFPFLAINVYEHATDARASYCSPSVMVDRNGIQIGIIGAVGDCYSSIAADKVRDVYVKTGNSLTALVKAESTRLREQGADFIVYMIHDGYGQSTGSSVNTVTGQRLSSYYDIALSDGYVDLVFEGHTHQRYILRDEHGVYHLQNQGENKGLSHVEVRINSANGNNKVTQARLVTSGEYATLEDDPVVNELLDKYSEQVSVGTNVLGYNAIQRPGSTLCQLAAQLYCEAGVEKWGSQYDIVLGGGFFSIRSPYNLAAGDVTYGQLQTLFPFDNELVLCSIKGKDLLERFIHTDNDRYYIAYSEYGQQILNQLDPNGTYYVIVDSYSSIYGPNKLTEIERYGEKVYARDLLAEYVKAGGLN